MLKGDAGSPRHKFCIASLENVPLINGFVFAPPDRSILIQPSKVTRSCVDSKLALFGDFFGS